MRKLIDQQAAIDLFPDDALEWDTFDGYIAPHLARRMIRGLPSAQPEIIRCRECKYNSAHQDAGNADCKLFYGMTDQYGFCHMAERREE